MIISHTKTKFIFIHIFKTAGTSFRKVLYPFANTRWQGHLRGLFLKIGLDFYNPSPLRDHATVQEVISLIGRNKYERFLSFAVVRSPWDWQVSLYFYMLKNKDHPQHELIRGMKSFDEYIKWRCDNEVRLQRDFLVDQSGKIVIKKILRFEALQEDFKKLCDELKISANLPQLNKSDHRNYREYYNSVNSEMVAKTFRQDIELFNYQF